ncbi:hypothetical protein C8T65DRAFT_648844 [Cerioporus squamosus]|nr:hypothetical protein C8T65DRAFT_648844 [Cerioporus squamosus]
MSSNADSGDVALFNSLNIESYCDMASSILFIYDAFVTFDQEVAYLWAAKRTGASFLFFANKWISVTSYVMTLVTYASFPSDKSCSMFGIAITAVQILQFVPWGVFSALRAYVLSRSKLLGSLVLALSMSPVGANLVYYGYQLSGENFPPFGCLVTDNTTAAVALRNHTVVIISRVPLIFSDILLIYITWTHLSIRGTLRDVRQSRRLSLSDILFRDGYVLFILNILHLIFSITAVASTSESEGSYITTFTAPITAILVSRFLLELQEANQTVIRVDADDPLHFSRNPYDDSTPSFISSLGAFIQPDFPEPRNDDDSTF